MVLKLFDLKAPHFWYVIYNYDKAACFVSFWGEF